MCTEGTLSSASLCVELRDLKKVSEVLRSVRAQGHVMSENRSIAPVYSKIECKELGERPSSVTNCGGTRVV